MSRYTYIHTQIWKDKKFRALSDDAKLLYIAMLTAPNSNMIGLYEWPVAYAVYDLGDGWTEQNFFDCIDEIEAQGMAYYDRESEIVFIANFLKHNPLNTIKQVIGGWNYFNALPATPLFAKFLLSWIKFVDEPLKARLDGRGDDSAKKSLSDADRILSEIKRRANEFYEPLDIDADINLKPIDSHSNTIQKPIESLEIIPVPVPGHGHVHGHKDKDSSVTADAATSAEACENETNITLKAKSEAKSEDVDINTHVVTLNRLLSLWNEILSPLHFPQALKSTPAREKAFKARLNALKDRESVDWWKNILQKLAASSFMLESAKNKANWLTFDWLLNENNLVKICEGKYDNRPNATKEPPKNFDEALTRLGRKTPPTFDEAMARYGFNNNLVETEARHIA